MGRPTLSEAIGTAISPSVQDDGLALYVHIPFCETKCPYCDFNTYAGIESLMPSYVEALAHETVQWGALLGRPPVSTVFFGGGTPSYLPPASLAVLMEAIGRAFQVKAEAEATLEANPGDLSGERLKAIRDAGFNRLSIGVQSLDDGMLRLLGRRHSAEQAKRAAAAARQAGFDSLSLDLIFGLPHQPTAVWERTLDEAVELSPDHISLYCLTLEPGTPMEADVTAGRLPEPDPDLAADMYDMAQGTLAGANYHQYEISNWALPGHTSRHNLTYWRNGHYLGVGPGAHSYLRAGERHGVRFANIKPPRAYIRRVNAWHPEARDGSLNASVLGTMGAVETVEALDAVTAMGETMMLGIRLNDGVSDADFRRRFGRSMAEEYPADVAECITLGLLVWEGDRLRLTDRGRPLGNEVFQRFVGVT